MMSSVSQVFVSSCLRTEHLVMCPIIPSLSLESNTLSCQFSMEHQAKTYAVYFNIVPAIVPLTVD